MDIVHVIDELESLPASGTRVPGFKNKVLVDAERLMDLSAQLREAVPGAVQEAQEVLNQQQSIVNQAYLEAQRIRTAAEQEASTMTYAAQEEHSSRVDESEIVKAAEQKADQMKDEAMLEAQQIVQDAQRRAYRIVNEAEAIAGSRREGADQYAGEVLFNLEERLSDVLGQVRKGIDALRLEEAEEQQVAEAVAA